MAPLISTLSVNQIGKTNLHYRQAFCKGQIEKDIQTKSFEMFRNYKSVNPRPRSASTPFFLKLSYRETFNFKLILSREKCLLSFLSA